MKQINHSRRPRAEEESIWDRFPLLLLEEFRGTLVGEKRSVPSLSLILLTIQLRGFTYNQDILYPER